jgi:pimeloyl-ACP methyl ester carboxylesterase
VTHEPQVRPDAAFNAGCDYREHFVTLRDGLRMYCREYGPNVGVADVGAAVLCLPGLTRNCRDFESLARALAPRHRVLTPDLRGRGRSDRDPVWQNYQPLTYAQDVGELLAALRAPRVVLIGTSLGGLIAMILAMMKPECLAGVMLNDIGPELDPRGLARIASYVGKLPPVTTWQEAAAQAKLVNGGALPDFTDEDWMRFARAAYRDDGAGLPLLDMDPRIGDAARQSGGAAPDLWMLFRALRAVPTSVLRGELSDLLAESTVERMLREKPDLRVTVVPGRGHAPTLDEPVSRAAIEQLLVAAGV